MAAALLLFLNSRAFESVVRAWVALLRGLPWRSAWALRPVLPAPASSSLPSLCAKLLWPAHAWISVSSTEK